MSDTLAHVAETRPNCNGVRSGNVRVDVNGDGLVGTLAGSNNWGTLIYGGGVVGGGASPVERSSQQVRPGELTWEQAKQFAHLTSGVRRGTPSDSPTPSGQGAGRASDLIERRIGVGSSIPVAVPHRYRDRVAAYRIHRSGPSTTGLDHWQLEYLRRSAG